MSETSTEAVASPTEAQSDAGALTGASETLLIPLASRARASRDKLIGDFHDAKAEQVCTHYTVDLRRYAADKATMRGVIARGAWFDRRVSDFLTRHPDGVVFSIGSGLNSMYERVAALAPEGEWHWIDSDLADVIDLRRQVFPDDDRRANIVFDAAEPGWPSHEWLQGAQPLMVVSEAVLIYVDEERVKTFFQRLAKLGSQHAECTIAYDWCSPEMVKRSRSHPALKKLNDESVVFVSAMRQAEDIQRYDPRWRVVAQSSELMRKSGISSALFDLAFRAFTGGRKIYGLAEARLETDKG